MKNLVAVSVTSLIFAIACNTKEISEKNMNITPPKADKISET